MVKSGKLVVMCMLILIAGGSECPEPVDNDNSGNMNTNSNSNANDNTNGATYHTLTLTLQSADPNNFLMQVYVFIDDIPLNRSNAPYSVTTPHVRVIANGPGGEERDVLVENGRWVTLVAFDGLKSYLTTGTTAGVPDVPEAVEFVAFGGDIAVGDLGNFGEASFLMNGDRSITAHYQPMPWIDLQNKPAQEAPQFRVGAILGLLEVSDFLTFPGESGPFDSNFGYQGRIVGYVRTSSKLTLEPNPASDPDLIFLGWSGDCGGTICVMTAGEEFEATSTWEEP